MSVYPYTDFDDKVFVYDSIKGLYEASSTPVLRDSPEIWHGVIMPNTGSDETNRTRIVNFLDKSHDFYAKQGVFANSRIEPSMLYIDLFHNQKASRLPDWKAYNLYLENLEDIAYNRFNKHLAQRLYDTYQKILDDSGDISSEDIKEFTGLSAAGTSDLSLKTTPDVQTRAIILKSVKQFFEVINEKHIGDILKYVYYTGRYGENSNIRADLAPVIIGKQDEFMKRALKDGNTVMESAIDAIVKNGLSRDIALSVSLEE